jgi:DNA-binding XRE family transcriptional regulator
MNPSTLSTLRIKRALQLRAFRIQSKMTKSALSRKSGLCRNCINAIESGSKPWNIDSELIYLESLKPILNLALE